MEGKFPKYFLSIPQHKLIKYWIIDKSGHTICVKYSGDPTYYRWLISAWDGWISSGVVKEIPAQEAALM